MPFAVQPDSIEYLLETCNLSGRPIYLKFNMKNEGMTEDGAHPLVTNSSINFSVGDHVV